jgi:transcriptional regulator with XRE-family HTH domain
MHGSHDAKAGLVHPLPDDDTLGGRLWRARGTLNLSIVDVAESLGVPSDTVSDWERDRSAPDDAQLSGLTDILRVPPRWLIAGINEPEQAPGMEVVLAALAEAKARQAETLKSLGETGRAIDALEMALHRVLQDK